MIVRKIIESVLAVGQTSIVITDTDIPYSLIRVYSNDPDLMPVQRVLTGNTLKLDYEAQASEKYIAVELVKQGLEIVDSLESTSVNSALSANQGKVLKGLIDNITPIRELTELDDVSVTDLTDGDILKYNAEADAFENRALPNIPVNLGDLGDIVLNTVTEGQVLTYNGAYWTNEDPAGGEVYSTTETVIGTWLNKPLYRKVIVFNNDITIPYNSWYQTGASIPDIDIVINAYIPTYGSVMCGIYNTNMLHVQTPRNNDNVFTRYLTVEYTKTTD